MFTVLTLFSEWMRVCQGYTGVDRYISVLPEYCCTGLLTV